MLIGHVLTRRKEILLCIARQIEVSTSGLATVLVMRSMAGSASGWWLRRPGGGGIREDPLRLRVNQHAANTRDSNDAFLAAAPSSFGFGGRFKNTKSLNNTPRQEEGGGAKRRIQRGARRVPPLAASFPALRDSVSPSRNAGRVSDGWF